MRAKSVGRIASCASCTWRAPERWTLGLRGRYASPKRSRTTRRAAPSAAFDSATLSVRM